MAETEDQLAGTEGELADLMQVGVGVTEAPDPSPQAPVISPPWIEARPPAAPGKGREGSRKRRKRLVITVGTPSTGTFTGEYVASLFQALTKGRYDFRPMLMEGSVIYHSRNTIATSFPPDSDYVLFIDSDMSWNTEAIDKLVEAGKDIIAALAYARAYPFRPTIFNDDGSLPAIPHPLAPFQVDMVGAAFMLIKAHVFKMFALARPWLGLPFDPLPQPLGRRSDFNFEDLSFCQKARRLGFSVWCHPGCDIGHVGKQVHSTQGYLAQGFVGFRSPPADDLTGAPPSVNFNPKRGRR